MIRKDFYRLIICLGKRRLSEQHFEKNWWKFINNKKMTLKFYLFGIFMAIISGAFATSKNANVDTAKTKYSKFFILEFADKPPIATKYAFYDPMVIDHSVYLSDSSNFEISKLLGVNFVVVLKLKPHIKLLSFNEVLDLFKITTRDRNLSVSVDDELVDYPETIWISQNQIEKVSITKGISGSYISITLIGYEEIKKDIKNGVKPNANW